jgi:hypothetical protein
LEHAAPEFATVIRERFTARRLALLGTVRADGSPRISPVEPYFAVGQLLFGAMGWSRKAVDLLRDSRLVLHSIVTRPDGGEPEAKLYGRAVEADAPLRAACSDAWWVASNASARVFAVQLAEATLVEWDLSAAEVKATAWSPAGGLRVRRRSYP